MPNEIINVHFIEEILFLKNGVCSCKGRDCLGNLKQVKDEDTKDIISAALDIRKEMQGLSAGPKRNAVRDALLHKSKYNLYKNKSKHTKANINKKVLVIEYNLNGVKVCKGLFCLAYNVGKSYIDYRILEIKQGIKSSATKLGDHSAPPLIDLVNIRKIAAKVQKGEYQPLTADQVGAGYLSNSPRHIFTYNWMDEHFDLTGDAMPNRG
jgi:hypothetical protein